MPLNRSDAGGGRLWTQWTRRTLHAYILALVFLSASLPAQPLFTGSEALPMEVDRLYSRGLQFLAKTQTPGGYWPDSDYARQPGVVGLATLAMLAHGDDPNFGPYSKPIHNALDFIVKHQDKATGYIGPTMYNHGFATLALAEAYGQVNDPRLGPALRQAVRLIMDAQTRNPNKAWRYSPEAADADTTVSGCQMVALLAARNAGIPVPEHVVQDGLNFFRDCQTPDGGMGYTARFTGGNAPRTAIACLVFALAKQKSSPEFKSGFDYLKSAPTATQYPEYFLYYASQAYFHASPELWQTWNRENLKTLSLTQNADGSWDSGPGTTFGTAACLLSLALNYRYLPIYER